MTEELPVTAALVRAMYPDVKEILRGDEEHDYCVLGALGRFQGAEPWTGRANFPMWESTGAANLMRANYRLTTIKAMRFAKLVTKRNDRGDFERAWRVLDIALRYGR